MFPNGESIDGTPGSSDELEKPDHRPRRGNFRRRSDVSFTEILFVIYTRAIVRD